ncbi:sigma-70 family RNA polymerase sigma factor [Calycomorphotria hydatis]|uniref:RNA polymerase sigma factor n=1 Tax=Calycomorphotria hydatis TaxID=2528027 RepID=A0A517T8K1_9PLAN|nr:sigma-70 family RNA polymerase sigma factor [Calycomorphotria hydatis]QDT64697.1 RNA polymerase sigma factor [Calycomorphotria hydatis]
MKNHPFEPEFEETDGETSADSLRKALFTKEFTSAYWKIYFYVTKLIPNRHDADDVMQDVAVVLWAKFDHFEPGTSFVKWAQSIAFRESRTFARKKEKRVGYGLDDQVLKQLAQVQSGVSELLELRQLYLDQCIDRLRESDRSFLFACEGRHGSVAKMAKEMKLPAAKLYERLRTLRRKLARCIQKALAEGDLR